MAQLQPYAISEMNFQLEKLRFGWRVALEP